jgi:hypothetical protein
MRLKKIVEQMRVCAWGPLALVVIAISLWATSLAGADLNPGRMNDLGLISVLPSATYVALAILIFSFCLVVRHRTTPSAILLLHVVSLIVMTRGIPPIFYDNLRYEWAWKHVGITEYFQQYGSIVASEPHTIPQSAHLSWPGFFAASAFVTEIAAFASPMSLAPWAPLAFNLLYLGPLYLIFRSFSEDQRLVWLGIWFFYLTQWVGQDYFAPQPMGYVLFLVILGICVRWFRPTPPSSGEILRYPSVVGRPRVLLNRWWYEAKADGTTTPLTSSVQRIGLVLIVIILFTAIAASHQLTPFMTIAVFIALVLFRKCGPRNLPVLMTVIAVGWLVFAGNEFLSSDTAKLTGTVGRLFGNVQANLIDISSASPGQVLVAFSSRSLTAAVWALALVGLVRRLRNNFRDLTCILLAGTPFFLLLANAYDGEMLFRVFLFSLPAMAFLAAAMMYPSPRSGTSILTMMLMIILSAGLLLNFVVAHFGKDNAYVFTDNEVLAVEHLVDIAPAGSHIVVGGFNYPNRHRHYGDYTYWPIQSMWITYDPNDTEEVADVLHSVLNATNRWPAVYMITTRSQKAHVYRVGMMPPGTLDRLEQYMKESEQFRTVYANEDASIFTASTAARSHNGLE